MANALAAQGATPRLIFTGQHAELDPAEFDLAGYSATRLQCRGLKDPHAHVSAVTRALLPYLHPAPDLLIVQGDTSSALGGALAGFVARVPVAHVEAGLRTHDISMPWPEEEYRIAIDAHSELLFAPTELAAANLRAEAVPGAIFVTGNSGIDAVLKVCADLPVVAIRDRAVPHLMVSCHRRENWDRGLNFVASALIELAEGDLCSIDVLLHPNRYVRQQMKALLGGRTNIALVPPCSHRELIARMRACDLMLSDSGGVQEEAPALGMPLLILREKTERPEAIATGNMRLVGTDPQHIVGAVRSLLADPVALAGMARPSFPYGDGRAGWRIAKIIEQHLERSSQNLDLRAG